ncbi:MAG: agarase, partial [bacterium]|nr:agarase [bacterium]
GLFHTGLVGTRDQAERAQCYRDFLNACLDHPRFVGTHWFQWQDQALTGRSDGENYQIGFVTVTDTPYPELVEAARDIGATMYARRWGAEGANAK